MDIETAVDLTSESWAKLAKAKSIGLTHTLVIEAINSGESWEGIKDLLCLRLCNANIHIYTSCFMDNQQWEKESLAAYVNRFKMKAKRCKFTNDVATIRIFIIGLKNVHSLATHIYENSPQMLTDTISEVEKLNAAQQLTTTIVLPSTVNVMSTKKIAVSSDRNQDTSHDFALILSATNAMNMVTSSWTAQKRYLLQELQQLTTNLKKSSCQIEFKASPWR